MHVDLREFRSAYLAEVDEHLSAVNALLVELDSAAREKRTAPRSMRELMRLLHTVKGLSAMVGVDPIVTIAHRMENVLRASDRAASPVDERAIEALIRGARAIESRVQAVAGDKPVPEPPPALLAELDALELGEGPFSSSEVAGRLLLHERPISIRRSRTSCRRRSASKSRREPRPDNASFASTSPRRPSARSKGSRSRACESASRSSVRSSACCP